MRHLRYSFYGASVALSAGSCQFKGMTWTGLLTQYLLGRRIFDLSSVIAGYHELRASVFDGHDMTWDVALNLSFRCQIWSYFLCDPWLKNKLHDMTLGCGTEFAPEITTSILHSREQAIRRLLGHTAWETLNTYYHYIENYVHCRLQYWWSDVLVPAEIFLRAASGNPLIV